MYPEPHILATADSVWLSLELRIPCDDISRHMDAGIQEVLAHLAAHGTAPAGPLTCRHFMRPTTEFHFRLGFPLAAGTSVPSTDRLHVGTLPAGTLARAIHRGPYEGLPAAWGRLHAALPGLLAGTPGFIPSGLFRESYLTDPATSPDPATWETLLEIELMGKG